MSQPMGDNNGNPPRCESHERSRDFLDCSYGIQRVYPDRAGPANFQQPLNYRSVPGSSNRILAGYYVHSPTEAATKTCLHYLFHGTTVSRLGHTQRKPRLRSEAEALIQITDRVVSDHICTSRLHSSATQPSEALIKYRKRRHKVPRRRRIAENGNSASLGMTS